MEFEKQDKKMDWRRSSDADKGGGVEKEGQHGLWKSFTESGVRAMYGVLRTYYIYGVRTPYLRSTPYY